MNKNKKEINRGNFIFGGIVAAIIIIMVLVIYFANSSTTTTSKSKIASFDNKKVSNYIINKLSNVSISSINKALSSSNSAKPVTAISGQTPLVKNNLPRVLYVGADFCPYCAAERWALVIALSKFGTFSNLHYMTSSATDVYSNTATFTFYNSTYTSKYIDFTPVETETNTYGKLQSLTNNENSIFSKFDSYPYVSQSSAGSIPFVDIGNKGLIVGAQYSPSLLKGLRWNRIVDSIYSNNAPSLSVGMLSSAGRVIQAICKITNGNPKSVCTKI
jgi:hypothetical protein